LKKRSLLLIVILCSLLVIAGCNGRGNLKVIMYDQQQNLLDDVYVGVYDDDFEDRLRFAYSSNGVVQFYGLSGGIYYLKFIGNNKSHEKFRKDFKVRIENQKTKNIKVNLEK
jgi:hypothetical protein